MVSGLCFENHDVHRNTAKSTMPLHPPLFPPGRPHSRLSTVCFRSASSSPASVPPRFSLPFLCCIQRALPGPAVPIRFGPRVYSLHPDTKDIKLSDLWAGAGAWLINEALGREEEGGRMDGGKGAQGGRRKGRTGRLTDAQSADQSMGTFAELR